MMELENLIMQSMEKKKFPQNIIIRNYVWIHYDNFFFFSDGSSQLLGGCLRDFRNKPFPTKAKIEYYNNVLTVLFHSGMTSNDQDYEMCFRYENVYLPEEGYFGLSAATGGLAGEFIHIICTSILIKNKF